MKPEHKDLNPTELALLTWYEPDNPLYHNPEHPTIKLAGEIGELLDLYGKHKFKPGFNWFVCKCGHVHTEDCNEIIYDWESDDGYERITVRCECEKYIPLVLDELGDIWYYLRILAWMNDVELSELNLEDADETSEKEAIETMYISASAILAIGRIKLPLQSIYSYLILLLDRLDTTIEELTLLNYYKLNSDDTNHGWKNAR